MLQRFRNVTATGTLLALCALASHATFAQSTTLVTTQEIQTRLSKDISLSPATDDEGFTTPESSPHVSLDNILFDLNSADLRPSAKAQLDQVADALRDMGFANEGSRDITLAPNGEPAQKIVIEGHTCDLGTEIHNKDLSTSRAQAVVAYLETKGVGSKFMTTRGWGEQRPVAPNTSEPNRERNRRVDFVRVTKSKESTPSTTSRDLFESSSTDVRYLSTNFYALKAGDVQLQNNDIKTLTLGDKLRVQFRVLEGCHVYVLTRNPAGKIAWLFPAEDVKYGLYVYPADEVCLPGPGEEDWYTLDNTKGNESFFIIASPEPLKDTKQLEQLIAKQGTTLNAHVLREAVHMPKAEMSVLSLDHQ